MSKAIAKAILTFSVEYDENKETLEDVQNQMTVRIDELFWGWKHQLDITVAEVNETPLRTDGDRAGQTLLPGQPVESPASH